MLSYLLLFNKRLEFDFFSTASKIPTCTSVIRRRASFFSEATLIEIGVSLYVWMFVARANKVEGTMS